jgi:hypothetical protein
MFNFTMDNKNKSLNLVFFSNIYYIMSFNRLTYDSCAYSKTLQQSTDPLEYNLFLGKFESCQNCPNGDFPINLDFGSRSDVESDLKGQTRMGSKCPTEKFPTNSTNAVPFTPPVTCSSIYNLLPVNTGYPSVPPTPLMKPTSTGLKDFSSYGQNYCAK